jgi:integrase
MGGVELAAHDALPGVISERLGHENPAFTMKQYAHVLPGMQAEAAALIAALVAHATPQL